MLLKKQTVWLLTMLSLVVVLSVYYVTSPDGGSNSNLAYVANKDKEVAKSDVTNKAKENAVTTDDTAISSISSDDLFTALRLDLEDSRSKLIEQYKSIVASSTVSPEEKSKALDKMEKLDEIAAKESTLEMLIKSEGYDDALVRVDDNQVKVTVKAGKMAKGETTKTAANDIIRLIESEIGSNQNVGVTFQPSGK